MAEIKSIGLSEEFAECPKNWMEKMQEHLKTVYGGVESYCEKIGFGKGEQERLVEALKA